ncbi:MAG: class I SAM-dependent methyltransferase [Candidatus Hydrogenedens sp.]|jgi:SAM-dependent methyltransferase|nr:class I SAM-dependent methyltransferase [Candidatus Hydrogenedens sp.]
MAALFHDDDPLFSTATCAGCGAEGLSLFGKREEYNYGRCTDCGTLQVVPMPSASFLAEAYEKGYAGAGHCQGEPEVRNRVAIPQYDAICDALECYGAPGRVLDHGCGWGGLLERLRKRGIEVEGLEPSDAMAAYCEKAGFSVIRSSLVDLPGEEVYEGLLLSSVFEHLVDHDDWLAAAHRLLRPGGVLISLQPTARFATFGAQLFRLGRRSAPLPALHQVFSPPWHTVLFSLKGMEALLVRKGFTLEAIAPAPLQKEGGLTGLIQGAVRTVNALAYPFFGVHWPLWVGHVFVFRKRV